GAAAPAFKESALWKPAEPAVIDADGRWWKLYGDAELDALVEQADRSNQNLRVAEAQLRQARAVAAGARAAGLPSLGYSLAESRQRAVGSNGISVLGDSHNGGVQAGWEADFWGRIRRTAEAAGASAQASAADLAAARLALQAALVNDYLQLRIADRQIDLYRRTLEGYRKALALTRSQFKAGVVTRSDVALAEATLSAAQAQAVDLDLTRRQLEHAIAVLQGKTPAEFALAARPPGSELPAPPQIPLALPSQLLERRPDIAAAERRVAAANANIGVAQAAYYPRVTLAASYGDAGPHLGDWLAAPFRVWALGATLAGSIFDGGQRDAQVEQARAAFDAAAAAYRQTVLGGFQEVEDNLAALGELARERAEQDRAVRASRDSARVLLAQYRAGTANYLAVVVAQNLMLVNERSALAIRGRELAAGVALVKAIGGGWDASALNDDKPAAAQADPAATPGAAAKSDS
ncbi:MAG: efflux transporter outer membrane subunit, partial [Burkholderiales bacterium]|nr:efflux transporter outer membrane subunit [Burkholderiales bacterium]